MLDLIGDAATYLSAPAGRSRWQDTWSMKRTRREAMAALAGSYASWLRTGWGALATVVALGGTVLLGRGVRDLTMDGGVVAVLTMLGGVVLLLAGLAGGGYVLFTGTRLVGALRSWSAARADDGGPGVAIIRTPAVVVRLVLALLMLLAGLALVLWRTGVLTLDLPLLGDGPADETGEALWQWFAAVIALASALAAGSGAVRAGLALRRRAGKAAKPAQNKRGATAQQQYAPPSGAAAPGAGASGTGGMSTPGLGGAPETADTWRASDGWRAAAEQQGTGGWQGSGGWGGAAEQQGAAGWQGGADWNPSDTWQAADTWQPGRAPQPPGVPEPPVDAPAPPVAEPTAVAEPAAAAEAEPPAPSPEEDWAATRKVGDLPARPAPAPAPPSALHAVLADGRTIADTGLTLLGRSPAGRPGETPAGLVALEDASVSKTHLALRLDGGQAWATDRASTNGSVLVRDGHHETLTAWEEVPLAGGDQLLLGTATVRIEAAGAS